MDLGLGGRSALVLGASKGIGKACAFALAREGVNVMLGARGMEQLAATAEAIRAETGVRVEVGSVDVTDPGQCEAIVAAARAAFGRVDILVNNAGGPPFGTFESFSEEQWRAAMELNPLSVARFIRLVLPDMKAAGWGRIINVTSWAIQSVLPGSVLSTAGRLGVAGLSKLLADEVGPFGITVNNVAPGSILTDRVRDIAVRPRLERGMDEQAAIADIAQGIPVRRVGNPEELAAVVAFLASAHAGYITGATIPVDGGVVRAIL